MQIKEIGHLIINYNPSYEALVEAFLGERPADTTKPHNSSRDDRDRTACVLQVKSVHYEPVKCMYHQRASYRIKRPLRRNMELIQITRCMHHAILELAVS